jgi:hypothetical protein
LDSSTGFFSSTFGSGDDFPHQDFLFGAGFAALVGFFSTAGCEVDGVSFASIGSGVAAGVFSFVGIFSSIGSGAGGGVFSKIGSGFSAGAGIGSGSGWESKRGFLSRANNRA